MPSVAGERGLALVAVLAVAGLIASLGLGLAVLLSLEHLSAANQRDASIALYAAESGIEIAGEELSRMDDWSPALAGTVQAAGSDPVGVILLPGGGTFDVPRETLRLTCGRTASCSDAQRRAVTADRPWGDRNPDWQPFLIAPFDSLVPAVAGYVIVVWLGDDVLDGDGRVDRDEAMPGAPGRYVARARALAIGPRDTRRTVEAVIARPCVAADGVETCAQGIRVQSWHAGTPSVP